MTPSFTQTAAFWLTAMALMMVPMAAPTLGLLWRACGRHAPAAAWGFGVGHAGVWLLFSLALAGIQQGLQAAGWPRPATALLLVAAALYQFSPWKSACLSRCRSPLGRLLALQRPGWAGGLAQGWYHGIDCLGCCWMLMLTMLGAGMMAPVAMLAIAVLIGGERLLPLEPRTVTHTNGVVLLGWALWTSLDP